MTREQPAGRVAPLPVVAGLLVVSGFCALVYQTTWLREFRLVFGSSTAASAAVLAIFMGGLGAGASRLGRLAQRHPRPLALYGWLELGIAASAAASPLAIALVRALYVALGGTSALGLGAGSVVRLLLSALVLAIPTFLMGGTLPAAARAVTRDEDQRRLAVGALYGLNTLGGVAGCALATFLLLERLGNRETLWLACAANGVLALLALWLARRVVPPPEPTGTESEGDLADVPGAAPARLYPIALCAAAAVGFAFLLMELVWYRMLSPLLGGSTFTFGLILAIALAGIGIGGAAYAFLGGTRSPTLRGFAWTCGAEAACIALPFALGDRLALAALLLRPLGSLGFDGNLIAWIFLAGVTVFPAAVVSGYQFPLLIGLVGTGRRGLGRQVGQVYAWNTAGAIAGSIAGGFGLLPLLSAPGAWLAVVLALCGLSALAAALAAGPARERLAIAALAGGVVAMVLSATGPSAAWRHSGIGAGRASTQRNTPNQLEDWVSEQRRIIRFEAEGIEASVAIAGRDGLNFVVNGKSDGNARTDAQTQVMSGLVGAALRPEPRRAFVVGLGTGSTAGWVAAVPSLERVDVVELEPAIEEMARRSAAVNHQALENPKLHLSFGDAREALLTTRERYDLVISEPSNPFRAGIASLFTHEFYQAARERLTEQGLFLQWFQLYDVDGQTVRTVFATLASVFPVVEAWETSVGADLLLIGALHPVPIDVDRLRRVVASEPYREALAATWRSDGLEGFLAAFLAGDGLARAILAEEGDRLNSDDRNTIEFGLARAVATAESFDVSQIRALAEQLGAHRPSVTGTVDWQKVDDKRIAFEAGLGMTPTLRAWYTDDQKWRARAHAIFLRGDPMGALRAWDRQPGEPSTLHERAMLAEALASVGNEKATVYAELLRADQPAEADAVLAILRARQGRFEEATGLLESALARLRIDPWPAGTRLRAALGSAGPIADSDPRLARRLYDALGAPFAVEVLEEERIATRFDLGTRIGAPCAEILSPYEPNLVWQEWFLRERLACYEREQDPATEAARRDLERFLAAEPRPFIRRE
jgi:predicted membrane-bound spermidine synthase